MKRKILFILFCICSFSSMVASKRTGTQDRELWVKYLCRIASPVIDNLAKGTLEANMPVETGKNFYGNPRDVTYLGIFSGNGVQREENALMSYGIS